MAYACKVLADSRAPSGSRLTTMEITYPRFVHSEFMTHRVFSRNAASSRAIPVSKMLERVKNDPVLPVWWGKNQAGMQAEEELTGIDRNGAHNLWLMARDRAVEHVERLMSVGLHKQVANRILEPWMWITVIASATDWNNFLALRCHPAAQPELRKIAEMMRTAYDASVPVWLPLGEWHLPLVEDFHELVSEGFPMSKIIRVCVGRCARISYLTHDGVRDPAEDIGLHDKLLGSRHMSPFEHAAQAMRENDYFGNFRGFKQYRKLIPNEHDFGLLQSA